MVNVRPCSLTFTRFSLGSSLLIISISISGCARCNVSSCGAKVLHGTQWGLENTSNTRRPRNSAKLKSPFPSRRGSRKSGAAVPAFNPSRLILLRERERLLKCCSASSLSSPNSNSSSLCSSASIRRRNRPFCCSNCQPSQPPTTIASQASTGRTIDSAFIHARQTSAHTADDSPM